MWARSYRRPIYITENGIADGSGTKRRAFLDDHLRWLATAMKAGADVRGYFHWSLTDNFEWADGFGPRFGLYRVDYPTQERTLTDGGRLFSDIAGANALRGRLPE
jgi:beta-glucosidase